MEQKDKEIVLSGIRPTGNLHLGNYYGALSKFVKLQQDPQKECLFFIADLHALTTAPDPEMLHQNVRNILAEYLAAGLDPDKASIFVQSDIPEIPEMYLLLNMHVGIGELMRTASFKDKARKQLGLKADGEEEIESQIVGNETSSKRVNAGLLTYPTLMAVDILIQKAHKVPVGKDQEQHLELTRRFARRFNSFYGVEVFPEPVNFNFGGQPVKVPGLDGSGKMGKSEGNCIYLIDEEKVLRKKVMRAVTDEGPKEPNQPVSEPVENLFSLMSLTSSPETVQQFREAYADCSIRYGDMKKQLAEDILKVTLPIRERYLDIVNDDALLGRILARGAERARERASQTLKEVRQVMGIRKFNV